MKLLTSAGIVLSLSATLAPQTGGPPAWTRVSSGLEVATAHYKHRPGAVSSFTVTALRADLKRHELRVVDLNDAQTGKGKAHDADEGGTIRALTAMPRLVAAMSGGFITSYSYPRPIGLVVTNKGTRNPLSRSKLFSGVLCVDGARQVRIVSATLSRSAYADCSYALQSGPLIVEPNGRQGISTAEPATRVFERSAVCLDAPGRVLFIYSSPTSLFDLAAGISDAESRGGLGCVVAMNLSGESDAGVLWTDGSKQQSVGSLDASLATALVLHQR